MPRFISPSRGVHVSTDGQVRIWKPIRHDARGGFVPRGGAWRVELGGEVARVVFGTLREAQAIARELLKGATS